MAYAPSPSASITGTQAVLHFSRVVLVCATLTHERHHPALALLILLPLNHFLYHLTSTLQQAPREMVPVRMETRSVRSDWLARAGVAAGLHLIASIGLIQWYGSFDALRADVAAFSRTWEWWALVLTLIALNVLYRPLARALGRLVNATGLLDSRLWSALFLAIVVWIWCDAVFAAVYQQLSLYCNGSTVPWCEGGQLFSRSLARFVDAAYFSTITLSTTGYGDIVPVSGVARALVAVEIIVGLGLLGFLLSRVAGYVSPGRPSGQSGLKD